VDTYGKFDEALERFCAGRYLEAQESFEALWHGAEGGARDFYQGWVLAAAALFHRDRGNARGAVTCVARAETHWQRVGPVTMGPQPETVLAAVRGVLDREWVHPVLPGHCPAEEPGELGGEEPWEDRP